MSGSLLGPDQIRKVNQAYPALVDHIRTLLAADHTGVGLMRVHMMVESFDSDFMASLFRDLSFISPYEKKALVRAAIYQLVAKEPALFIAPDAIVVKASIADTVLVKDEPKLFTPPQFKLNVNRAEEFHGQESKDTPAPAPIVTSTHTSKVADMVNKGDKYQEASKPIAIPVVPEDAVIPQE